MVLDGRALWLTVHSLSAQLNWRPPAPVCFVQHQPAVNTAAPALPSLRQAESWQQRCAVPVSWSSLCGEAECASVAAVAAAGLDATWADLRRTAWRDSVCSSWHVTVCSVTSSC